MFGKLRDSLTEIENWFNNLTLAEKKNYHSHKDRHIMMIYEYMMHLSSETWKYKVKLYMFVQEQI